ncbi:hypothetical protein BEK98_44160 [Streptomyces diastatochromogenes]|uniref:Uncharacterized protein n=1 Tax=Streptomyces diastatochromogenes TaxID=42236 RepID=A0A233RUS4_STRDA|nr:hypothetical protein BEK98_44160 [Streptomyces diastatochromogenes]
MSAPVLLLVMTAAGASYPARFQLAHVLSREPRETEPPTGRLDAARFRLTVLIDGLVDVSEADHWRLCGTHGVVLDAQRVLAGWACPATGSTRNSSSPGRARRHRPPRGAQHRRSSQ